MCMVKNITQNVKLCKYLKISLHCSSNMYILHSTALHTYCIVVFKILKIKIVLTSLSNLLCSWMYWLILHIFFCFIEIRQFILLHMLNKGKDIQKLKYNLNLSFLSNTVYMELWKYILLNYLQYKNNDSPIYKTWIMIIVKMYLHIKYFINLKIILKFNFKKNAHKTTHVFIMYFR